MIDPTHSDLNELDLAATSFTDRSEDTPCPAQRVIENSSSWSEVIKPFLLDNVGWFVGAFLVVAGFVILIVNFRGSIEQSRMLTHFLVFFSLTMTTGMFFSVAYFMRRKYPQLASSSNVLFSIVALLVPLVFVAAMLTTLATPSPASVTSPSRTASPSGAANIQDLE